MTVVLVNNLHYERKFHNRRSIGLKCDESRSIQVVHTGNKAFKHLNSFLTLLKMFTRGDWTVLGRRFSCLLTTQSASVTISQHYGSRVEGKCLAQGPTGDGGTAITLTKKRPCSPLTHTRLYVAILSCKFQ